ncbi:MAG: NUDIX domain-containing protein [Phycisphaerae bacterium]
MPSPRDNNWTESRALIQGAQAYLIILPDASPETPWAFPGGRITRHESPEHGLRRVLRDLIGVEIEFHVGQPPFVHNFGSHSVTYRYYQCSIRSGQPQARACAELRWVIAGQLRDYTFDQPTQQVVDWLLERE